MIPIAPGIALDPSEIAERFVRASGPGGQNVNKVATAVELRFDIAGSASLPEALRARLLALRDRRITRDGVLVIAAQRHRTQERNRADALSRLVALIAAAAEPETPRRATRPTRASREQRLKGKLVRARTKAARGRVRADD